MERLTIKNSDGTYSQPTHTTFEKMFYKLAEFEDFMEDNNFHNLQSLKDTLYQANMELYSMRKTQQENQALQDRWKKLKEFVTKNFNYFKNSYGIFDDIFADDYRKVLNKIQRLENGSDTNVDTK